MMSVRVCDPTLAIRNFVPANCSSYSLDDSRARHQLTGEFLTSFVAAANALSSTYRVSQLPSQTVALGEKIREGSDNAGTWPTRFGLELVSVAIENIEFSEQSRELVRQFSEKRMGVRAYEDVSQRAADISAQQLIAQGVRDNGLGDGGAMVFGMNLAGSLDPRNASVVRRCQCGRGRSSQKSSRTSPPSTLRWRLSRSSRSCLMRAFSPRTSSTRRSARYWGCRSDAAALHVRSTRQVRGPRRSYSQPARIWAPRTECSSPLLGES